MRKLLVILSLLIVFFLSGCKESLKDLNNHIKTVNSLDSYVIEMESKMGMGFTSSSYVSYIYVDNTNDIIKISENSSQNVNHKNYNDLVIDLSGKTIYGYVYEDDWYRYEMSDDTENTKSFEASIIGHFDNDDRSELNSGAKYSKNIRIEDLDSDLKEMLSELIDEDYYDIFLTLEAIYRDDLEMFTEVSINLNTILQRMYRDQGVTNYGDARWTITYSFDRMDESFEITIPEYVEDDYINSFDLIEYFDFDIYEVSDMLEGELEFEGDVDIFKLQHDSVRRYQINLTSSIGVGEIIVRLVDEDYEVVFETVVSKNTVLSEEFLLTKGTYYLVISKGVSYSEFSSLTYAFTFIEEE